MKAVILAAGRGTRLGALTSSCPKPLVELCHKPLIEYTLEALPMIIDECIIVVDYLGDMIRQKIGKRFRNCNVRYVTQKIRGTGGALLSARRLLEKDDEFMVVGADDIFGKGELEKIIASRSITKGIHRTQNVGVGAYVLSPKFFKERFASLPNGELSIPHTLDRMWPKIRTVEVNEWLQVNTPEQKMLAESWLTKNRRN